jgi:hypothetical protein
MTTIKATCPTCGDVDLKPRDITVVVAPAAGWANYQFSCPTCQESITKVADDEVVTLLRGAGVRVEKLQIPAEALELRLGPPLADDDLIDFGLRLSESDLLVEIMAQEAR